MGSIDFEKLVKGLILNPSPAIIKIKLSSFIVLSDKLSIFTTLLCLFKTGIKKYLF